ncbi:MAG: hypothetical protein K940chlam3_00720 [Chlamydiae bacterium]|nr:hypothetical protein [Chlamydiota bacterium]
MPDNERDNFYPADKLLKREPDIQYINEWTSILQDEKLIKRDSKEHSLLLFRIHHEWFGLSTSVFNQVCEKKTIHTIPYRKNPTIKGLVNIGGQIRICVALDELLNISQQEGSENSLSSVIYNRMIVIEKEDIFWVFPVDEVFGIFQFDMAGMENVPVNISKSSSNYLKGVLSWKDKSIGFLDEELLFYSLKKSI